MEMYSKIWKRPLIKKVKIPSKLLDRLTLGVLSLDLFNKHKNSPYFLVPDSFASLLKAERDSV